MSSDKDTSKEVVLSDSYLREQGVKEENLSQAKDLIEKIADYYEGEIGFDAYKSAYFSDLRNISVAGVLYVYLDDEGGYFMEDDFVETDLDCGDIRVEAYLDLVDLRIKIFYNDVLVEEYSYDSIDDIYWEMDLQPDEYADFSAYVTLDEDLIEKYQELSEESDN